MRGVDDVLILQGRVRADESGDDVLGLDLAQLVLDLEPGPGPERDGPEILRGRGTLEGVEVLPRGLAQGAGFFQGDPRLDGDARGVAVPLGDVEVLAAPAPDDDREGIARRTGLVDDERRRGPLGRGDLIFVRPAAVIGHRLPLEHRRVELLGMRRVGDGRVVDEHHDRLAADVDPLVVVPAVLRRDDAVADEDDLGVLDLDLRRRPPRDGDPVLGRLEVDRCATDCDRPRRRLGPEPDQRDVLEIRPVGVARLQPHRPELLDEVRDRLLLPRGPRPAPLEGVGGEHLDRVENPLAADRLRRRCRVVAGDDYGRHHQGCQDVPQSRHRRPASLDRGPRPTHPSGPVVPGKGT